MILRFARGVLKQLIKFFVTDWLQTGLTIGILAAGWAAIAELRMAWLGFVLAAALAGQLAYATISEAARRELRRT